MRFLSSFFLLVVGLSLAGAQDLPSLSQEPWIGYFLGYTQRNVFEFGIENEGDCHIFLFEQEKKRGTRVGKRRTIHIKPFFITRNPKEGEKQRNWTRQKSFTTQQKPSSKETKAIYEVELSYGLKIGVEVLCQGKEILFKSRVLDRGESRHLVAIGWQVQVPAVYGPSYRSAKNAKIRGRMRRDYMHFVRADNQKKVRVKTYKKIDLRDEKYAPKGVLALEVRMDGLEKNTLKIDTQSAQGVLLLSQPQGGGMPIWEGFTVDWRIPYDAKHSESKDYQDALRIKID